MLSRRLRSERKLGSLFMCAVAAVMLGSLFFPTTSWAVCDQTSQSDAFRRLWDQHGCWPEFIEWQYRAYNMRDDDWGDRGWNDACNPNMEYAKHWSTAYLITYGIADNSLESFHGTIDYRATAEADDNNYHGRLNHQPSDHTDWYGQCDYDVGEAEIYTSCLHYDANQTESNPASLAATFLHEAWHAWEWKYDYYGGDTGGHHPGYTGNCSFPACDYFYFHGIGNYNFGDLWENDGTANRFHSPYQVEVEFLCDLVQFHKPWVPREVIDGATAAVNGRLANNFINGPGYKCGDPRPW